MKFLFGLQIFSSKKGVGTIKNGRDSHSKRLGCKIADGSYAKKGAIIYRQRGTKIHCGQNVKQGGDDTLFAIENGIVRFEKFRDNKTRVSVYKDEKIKK